MRGRVIYLIFKKFYALGGYIAERRKQIEGQFSSPAPEENGRRFSV